MKLCRRSARRFGILLVGALLLAPGLGWAVEEEVKKSDAKAPASKEVDENKASKPAQAAKTGAVDPSFNTLEEITEFRGSLVALWSGQPLGVEDPSIKWREVVPSEPTAPLSAPLSNTTAR